MLVKYMLWALCVMFKFLNAAALDGAKVYAPNPPVTHRAILTIEYMNNQTKEMMSTDVTIELYGTVVPRTVDNFAKIAKGVVAVMKGQDEKTDRFTLGYQNTLFHRIISGFIIQGGDVLPDVGPFTIHGGSYFEDENFDLKHDRPGRVSMANLNKPDTNASQFFITMAEELKDLNGKHVVFGQVVGGLEDLMNVVQYVEVDAEHKPTTDVKVIYSLVEELRIANKDDLHKKYVEKLKKFQDGNEEVGVKMSVTLEEGKQEERIMRELKYEDLHHPMVKVVLGLVFVGIVYMVAKNRKRIFSRTSNIVSMRHE